MSLHRATMAVVLLAYPMAYYMAFRVHPAQAALDHPDHHAVLDQLSAAGVRLEGDPRLSTARINSGLI